MNLQHARPGKAPRGAIACPVTNKWGFATRDDAETSLAIRRHEMTGKSKEKPKSVYLCPWCDRWHMTRRAAITPAKDGHLYERIRDLEATQRELVAQIKQARVERAWAREQYARLAARYQHRDEDF